MHRLDTAKRTPRYHHNDSCLRFTPASTADPQERSSVRRVATIRRRLPPADRRLLDLYLQEGGNYAAVARRLGCAPESVRGRYQCLFRRIRAAV
jgi:transposase-like protein